MRRKVTLSFRVQVTTINRQLYIEAAIANYNCPTHEYMKERIRKRACVHERVRECMCACVRECERRYVLIQFVHVVLLLL